MRKLLLIVALAVGCLIASDADAANVVRAFTCLTGGTTGCLDKIDANDAADGDIAITLASGMFYISYFDADATDAESSPTFIRPDYAVTPGTPWSAGVWKLADMVAQNSNTLAQLKVPSSNADPTATAGYLRHDSTVSNHANGALRWNDGTNLRQVVDMIAATAEGCTDTQVIAYSADNDNFYCKDDAGGSAVVATDTIWDAAGDIVYGTGSNTASRLAVGTAGQVLKVNAGASAPEWTSTLSISGLSLGGIVLGDSTPDAAGEVGYASNKYTFYATDEDISFTLASDTMTFSTTTGITGISFAALNLVTTGVVSGAIPSSTDANGKDIPVAEQYGYMHWATGAGTWNMAGAAAGMSFCVYSTTAAAIVLNPDDADVIVLDGTALAAGAAITSASAAGDMVCLVARDGTNWHTTTNVGPWTGP